MMGVPTRNIVPVLACTGSDQSTRASIDCPPYIVKGAVNRRVVSNVLCKFVHYEFTSQCYHTVYTILIDTSLQTGDDEDELAVRVHFQIQNNQFFMIDFSSVALNLVRFWIT